LKSEIEIECKDPEIVIKSLKPDFEETKKFNVDLKAEQNKIILTIESDTISGLLAGINSYIRLIRTSIDTMEI
jgi:tRNA threonylcarbamoyladenosine modification (KEOPS) complex  Pcc1 subunit